MATMPPLPGSWDTLEENTPTFLSPLPGGSPVSIYCYPAFFETQPGDEMHTFGFEFVSALKLSPELIKEAMDHVMPMFLDGGEDLSFYFAWEKQEFDIHIPEQFCFFGHCWTPPWAGNTVLVVYRYRLWVVSRILSVGSLMARPVLPALAIIAIFAGICLVLGTIASIIFFAEGKLTAKQITEGVKGIVTAPGENFKTALSPLTWAGLGVGVLLIGMGIALPYATSHLGVTVPIGPARVQAGVESRGVPPPAPPAQAGRRR
jgi:hypothetical protein